MNTRFRMTDMMMQHIQRGLVAAIALLAGFTGVARAETFNSAFSISLWGLPLARLEFTSDVTDKDFAFRGTLRSSALADIVEPIRGTVVTTGRMDKNGAVPVRYDLKYTYGSKNKRTSIDLKNGNVTNYENVPPIKKSAPWIEVSAADLVNVFDPISGFVVRANSAADVCKRTVSVFDGEVRANIHMSFGREVQLSTGGYSGPAVMCRLRVDPVSGYRKGKKQIEFLRKSTNMSLTFAPVGNTGVYAPIQARIGTQIGIVSVNATRFGK